VNASQANYEFGLNRRLAVSLERIGEEQEPVLIIEDVLADPSALVDYAAREVTFAPVWGPKGGYPGIRAPAPLNYVERLVRALSPTIERAFGLEQVALARAECNFSLVTLTPDSLAPLQRIPHADTSDPLQFALLHYLCEPRFGGTAFYRQRATGFETLRPERMDAYERAREQELATAPAYIAGDSGAYLQTAAFEARPNRAIIYRSRTLHSGQISDPSLLSDDPRRGRLTANIFVNYRQA
jgi:hypothetical protein